MQGQPPSSEQVVSAPVVPFRESENIREPPSHKLRRIKFAGKRYEVLMLDGHLYMNFEALLPALVDGGLFSARPHRSYSKPDASDAMAWLLFYTYHSFPLAQDYEPTDGSDWVQANEGAWGVEFSNEVRLVDGTPWICVHALHSAMMNLRHMPAAQRPIDASHAPPARAELIQAYAHLLEWEIQANTRGEHICKTEEPNPKLGEDEEEQKQSSTKPAKKKPSKRK